MINTTDLVAQIINFILLVGLLYRLLYQPVKEFMDNRTNEIEQRIQSAQENQAAAEALRQELEAQAKDSQKQARKFLDEAARRAERMQADMIAEARKEAEALIQRAQEETRLEKEKAWAELRESVGELSLLLASRVIDESLDEGKHQKLIDETLDQLETLEIEGSL
ncbi:MAG: F0F1 ATP synthase subunit B [Firmicutes bacterium]|nr:F0F1 ATP synthase subunit B [Bacillota bacterium]